MNQAETEKIHLVCPQCLATNRVPEQRLADGPVCGQCRTRLLPDVPVALDGDAFERYVAGSDAPVLVDYWAQWCGPCRMMAPEFAALAARRADVRFVKVDTERNQALAGLHGIRSIPTLALFRKGREIARVAGAMRAAQLEQWLDQALGGSGRK